MKRSILRTLVLLIACLTRAAYAAVDVTVFQIEETRAVQFTDDHISRMPPEMRIVLSLRGPEAESSIRYGDIKLEQAVDDRGTDLIPQKDPFGETTRFKDYANAFFRKSNFAGNAKPDPQVDLRLALPKRAATKIARLRGSVTLADQGTIQTVELTNLKQPGKKALSFPPDAHVGVTVDIPSGDDVRSIGLEISGDEKKLDSVKIVDASGKDISSGVSSMVINGGPVSKSIQLNRPIDNSMKLVAKFAANQTVTVVPFDLKDIPLP